MKSPYIVIPEFGTLHRYGIFLMYLLFYCSVCPLKRQATSINSEERPYKHLSLCNLAMNVELSHLA